MRGRRSVGDRRRGRARRVVQAGPPAAPRRIPSGRARGPGRASRSRLGGGPTGVELPQIFVRFGVPVTLVQSGKRLLPSDHPRNSEAALRALVRDGVDVRLGVRAIRAEAGTGPGDADVVHLDNGTTVSGHASLAAHLDAFELVADFPSTARGYSVEATFGHITIVVDRATHELVGAAMAAPDASAAIHECVLAIRAHLKIDLLADTIHAFPSTSRIFNGLYDDARRMLAETPQARELPAATPDRMG